MIVGSANVEGVGFGGVGGSTVPSVLVVGSGILKKGIPAVLFVENGITSLLKEKEKLFSYVSSFKVVSTGFEQDATSSEHAAIKNKCLVFMAL